MIPIYLDPDVLDRTGFMDKFIKYPYITTWCIKRKYKNHPEVRIDMIVFKTPTLYDLLPKYRWL